ACGSSARLRRGGSAWPASPAGVVRQRSSLSPGLAIGFATEGHQIVKAKLRHRRDAPGGFRPPLRGRQTIGFTAFFLRGIWPRTGFRLKSIRRLGVPKQLPGDDNVGRMQFLLGLRRRGISDPAVLRAMDEVPREHFVENSFVDNAYADQALPIACGQTISQPYVVAFMTEQLDVRPEHRVLEVGTG